MREKEFDTESRAQRAQSIKRWIQKSGGKPPHSKTGRLGSRPRQLNGEEETEVAEVVAGGAGEDGVVEIVKESVRVAAGEEIGGREAELFCAGEGIAVGDGAGSGGVAVHAVSASAENRDGLAGNFFDAAEYEGGVAATDSLPGDLAAEFAVGDEGDPCGRILPAKVCELAQEIVGSTIERPIIGGIVTAGEEAFGFGGVMGGMEKIVRREEQGEMGIGESGMRGLGSFRRGGGEKVIERAWELVEQIVAGQEAVCVGDGGGIRQGWAGSKGGFFAEWHVGDGEGEFRRKRSSGGEAAAFDRGNVLANGVDLVDRGAAGDERLIEGTNVAERD